MTARSQTSVQTLPLAGVRVVEFSHMVMGPTCGMILGDLGAEVIKVEPLSGDNTRRLIGTGAGLFRMFNRNKKSVAGDLADPGGREAVARLIASADVLIENFKPGTMAKYGLDYPTLAARHPRLIYVAHKGFLPGRCAPELPSTTSWAACSARSACSRRCARVSKPGAARRCRPRCSRIACCWRASTCSNTR